MSKRASAVSNTQWLLGYVARRDRSTDDVLLPLFVIFVGTFGATSVMPPNDRLSYIGFTVMCAGFAWRLSRSETWATVFRRIAWQSYDLAPMAMLAVWLYGLGLGFALGNRPHNVVANFGGMALYVLYYVFLLARVRRRDLLMTVIAAALVNVVYMFVFFFIDKGLGQFWLRFQYHRFFNTRDYYSESLILVAGVFALLAGTLLLTPFDRIRERVLAFGIYPIAFALVQISLSKAILAFYVSLTCFLMFLFRPSWLRRFKRRDLADMAAIAGIFAIAVFPSIRLLNLYTGGAPPPPSVRSSSYVTEATASITRAEQTAALLHDLHMFGKGLGATISGGYKRDAAGYGFELNYLNLAHKFGVFTGVILAAYAFIALRVLNALRQRRTRSFGLASMGLFAGWIMGWGNPILMSPVMVALQCVVLYWLRPLDE